MMSGYSAAEQREYMKYLVKLKIEFRELWNDNEDMTNAELSDFDRMRVLGVGAFGIVCICKHRNDGKYYAMKMLEKKRLVESKRVESSHYEKKILNCLNFPFVIYLEYFFKDNVYIYFVLPYVSGGEMFTYLRKMGKFDESFSKFYGSQVVLALEYLHAMDLVYRDLKPENILIDRSGYIKITDFGFSKLINGRTWSLCGTPQYIAPEIILNRGYGMSVDWWSLGVLLFEMCAGYPPFRAPEPMKIYEKIIKGAYRCPAHFSKDLKDLCGRTLQVDVTKRYGNLKNGILDFKNHSWFKEIVWDDILSYRTLPPFSPRIKWRGDTSNFDYYLVDKFKESSVCLYEKEFRNF